MATNRTTIIDVESAHTSTDLPQLIADATKLNWMHGLVAQALCADDYPHALQTRDVAMLQELTWTTGVYLWRIGELAGDRQRRPARPAVVKPTRRRKAGAR
jgi:hypothetical protein